MKGAIKMIVLVLLLFVGVPLVIGMSAWNASREDDTSDYKIRTPDKVKVWISEEGKTKKIDFEEYVLCVVVSEMPSSFEEEALKAQAVAVRTYAMSRILKYEETQNETHKEAPLCDTVHCQVYKTTDELVQAHGKDWKNSGLVKVKKACAETEGELLYYNKKLVTQPLFFSSSGGQTENSEDVFSGEYPYLVSVPSPYEDGAKHENEKKTFSFKEVENKMNSAFSDRETGTVGKSNIKILSRTAGGRVDRMQIGKSTYKGTEVRSGLGLSSALFSVVIKENGIEITSSGYGHGVGLSQYGANGMAKQGKNYKEILSYYYTGTEVF